jgi:transglutaminase-like putative cysteine protease
MASNEEQKAPAGRLVLLAALLALQVSAAVAFGRVLQGGRPTLQLAFAAAVSVLLAGLMERRHILLATLVSAAGFLIVVGLVIFPETTRFGLPTLATLKAMRISFAAVGRTADVQPAPALPLSPLMLAGITGVWTAAFSSHALAVRARSPFLAIAPPGALLAFTSLVMSDGARRLYVLPFLASALAVLFADGLWRVAQWGPLTVWHGKRAPLLGTRTTTRGARRLALACLGVALILPGILPGFLSPGLVNVQGAGGNARVSINPIVDIRARLLNNPAQEVFTVKASTVDATGATAPLTAAPYWRFAVDDVFDGRTWSPSDPQLTHGRTLAEQPSYELTSSPTTNVTKIRQTFTFDQFYQFQLPAAYQPVNLDLGGERLRYDATTGVLFDTNGTHPGFTYTVTSEVPAPTTTQLEGDDPALAANASFYEQLPANLPREITTIAQGLVQGKKSIFDQIEAIKSYLRTFTYSTSVKAGHSTNDILHFLTVSKAGYCEQFAGTMAVLLRALHIPARVAVGFTGGRLTDGVWHVDSGDAHAWVEVPFPTYGWLAFDPTPGRSNALATYDTTPVTQGNGGGSGSPVTCADLDPAVRPGKNGFGERQAVSLCKGASSGSQSPGGGPSASPGSRGRGLEVGAGGRGESAGGRVRGSLPIVAGVVALLVLVALAIPVAKVGRRRFAWRRGSDPRMLVLVAYRAMVSHAADVGLGREPAETLWEYRTRLKERVASLDGDLDRLTRLAGQAAYADSELTREDAVLAGASSQEVSRTIRRSAGVGRRVVGWFRVERHPRV